MLESAFRFYVNNLKNILKDHFEETRPTRNIETISTSISKIEASMLKIQLQIEEDIKECVLDYINTTKQIITIVSQDDSIKSKTIKKGQYEPFDNFLKESKELYDIRIAPLLKDDYIWKMIPPEDKSLIKGTGDKLNTCVAWAVIIYSIFGILWYNFDVLERLGYFR